MADPTTLLDFATQQNAALKAALTKAQANLTVAQAAYTAAAKARDDTRNALSKTVADMASIRSKLAGAVTPEDLAALLLQLQADITQSRQEAGALSWKERAVAGAKADTDGAAAEVQRLTAAVTASNTALADAKAQSQTRADLKTRLADPPLSTIKADAAAVLAGTEFVDPAGKYKFADAQTRLQNDLPPALITEAEHRLQDEIARASSSSGEYLQAQAQVELKWTSDGGVTGSVLALQNAFSRAAALFTGYVTNANDRFQQAKAALAGVADPTNSPLTPAQKASINDATTVTNATAAVTAEKAVDDAADNLAQKQAILDEKTREAEAADPNADPATNPTVIAATGDRDTAKTQLAAAQTAYAAVQSGMTAWEVLVPDTEWQLFWSYEQAQLTLNWLGNPDPATLASDMDAAEQALVKALLAADKSAHSLIELEADAARRLAMANYEAAAAEGRRFSALRGDF
jgi:hypothetical protein